MICAAAGCCLGHSSQSWVLGKRWPWEAQPMVGKRASPVPSFCLQIEQRIEPAKRAAHSVSKRLQACLQGQCGSEMDKRVKKLPLMALSTTMAESFKELDTESSLGRALEMGCCIESSLAKILAEFEIILERDVLQPLNKLSEAEPSCQELQYQCWHWCWPRGIFCCQQTGDLEGGGGGGEEEGGAVQGKTSLALPHEAPADLFPFTDSLQSDPILRWMQPDSMSCPPQANQSLKEQKQGDTPSPRKKWS
uniref:Uncharacterized protein n=1 Tax=Melopsittacus undulatus TaxID=13146 RepID=A0A8V5FQW7_MELUD